MAAEASAEPIIHLGISSASFLLCTGHRRNTLAPGQGLQPQPAHFNKLSSTPTAPTRKGESKVPGLYTGGALPFPGVGIGDIGTASCNFGDSFLKQIDSRPRKKEINSTLANH